MPHPIPYLAFDGTCADAMRFYERALGGKLEILMRNADSPMACQMSAESLAEHGDRILHACLALPGGGTLYAGDCPASMPFGGMKGVALTLDYDTVEQSRQVFDALAEGGQVTMPPQATFWARNWGMLTDRFGTSWIINGERIAF